jgi:hypothetical protein
MSKENRRLVYPKTSCFTVISQDEQQYFCLFVVNQAQGKCCLFTCFVCLATVSIAQNYEEISESQIV